MATVTTTVWQGATLAFRAEPRASRSPLPDGRGSEDASRPVEAMKRGMRYAQGNAPYDTRVSNDALIGFHHLEAHAMSDEDDRDTGNAVVTGYPRLLANLGRRSRQEAAHQSSRIVKRASLLENHEGHEEHEECSRHSPLCRPLSVSRETVETRVACLRPGSQSRGTRAKYYATSRSLTVAARKSCYRISRGSTSMTSSTSPSGCTLDIAARHSSAINSVDSAANCR